MKVTQFTDSDVGAAEKGSNTQKDIQPSLYRRLRSHLARHRTNAWRLCGDTSENQNLMIAYAGREINKEYLKGVAFGDTCREKAFGRIWKLQLKQKTTPETSALVTEYNSEKEEMEAQSNAFCIPFWLGWIADISGDMDRVVKTHRTLQYNLSKIHKNNLEYEIIDTPEAYEYFYDTMYLPYMDQKFDSTALLMSREDMRAQHDICQLLYIKKGDQYLSGLIIKYEPDCPRIWSIGLKDANYEYIREGALGAQYYFLINYLKGKGYDRVNFGGTRAFHTDGVLNYKKKWPIKNAGFTKQGFHIRLISKSPEMIDLLTRCPFIFIKNETLQSAFFVGPDVSLTLKKIKKIHKSYLLGGVKRVVLYVFGEKLSDIEDKIPEDFKSEILVRSADTLFVR